MSGINLKQPCVLKGTQTRASSGTGHGLWLAPRDIAARLEVNLAGERGFCLLKIIRGFDIRRQRACTCRCTCPALLACRQASLPPKMATHPQPWAPPSWDAPWGCWGWLFLSLGSGDM